MAIVSHHCPNCGQSMFTRTLDPDRALANPQPCSVCVDLEGDGEGTPENPLYARLFEPAPNQIPGQLGF
jgi:hypothetical protein